MRNLSRSLLLATALGFGAGAALATDVAPGTQQAQMLMDNSKVASGQIQPVQPSTYSNQPVLYGDQIRVRYDTDRDGDYSDEVWVVRSKAEVLAEGNVVVFDEHSVKPVDLNGDGRITADEWQVETPGYYGSLDLNNNGIIDSEEVSAN